jgi:hypothetical protein
MKRKNTIMLALALVLILTMATCGGCKNEDPGGGALDIVAGPSDAPEGPSGNGAGTDPAADDPQESDGPAPAASDKEAYALIFLAYEEGIKTGFADLPYDPEYVCYAIAAATQNPAYSQNDDEGITDYYAIYAFADIDNDGTNELIIGEKWNYNGRSFLSIYDIWTVFEGKPKRLLVRHLGETDSSGLFVSLAGYMADTEVVDTSAYTIYSIDGNKNPAEKAVFTCNPSGSSAIYTMNSKEVTQEEYVNGLEEFGFSVGANSDGYYTVFLENPGLDWTPLFNQ